MAQKLVISAHNVDFTNMEIVCQRRFTLQGKDYQAGDVIPDGLIEPRRARQLFERRMISIRGKAAPEEAAKAEDAAPEGSKDHPKADAKPKGEGKKAAVAPAQAEDTPVATDPAPEEAKAADTPPVADAGAAIDPGYTIENGYKVEHRGFGRWHLMGPDGAEVSGPHKRAQIEHLIS
jgi:hypothetical protein